MTGNVKTSTTRKRSRVRLAPLVFFHDVRRSSVPKKELLSGSDVLSRMRLGAASRALQPLSLETASAGDPSIMIGLLRFSGPGRPIREPAPALVPLGSLKRKSKLLLFVSSSDVA